MNGSPEITQELLCESRELLATLTLELSRLRQEQPAPQILDQMHRGAHTLGGLIGFLDDPNATRLAAFIARQLQGLRDGESRVSQWTIQVIADTVATLEGSLEDIQKSLAQKAAHASTPNVIETPSSRHETKAHPGARSTRERLPQAPGTDWQGVAVSASHPWVADLTWAIHTVLSGFSIDQIAGIRVVDEPLDITTHDFTVVIDMCGQFDASILFGFERSCALAYAMQITRALVGEITQISAEEKDEVLRGALGEFANQVINAALKARGVVSDVTAPHFVETPGIRLLSQPMEVWKLSLRSRCGDFEVCFAPGASIGRILAVREAAAAPAARRRRVVVADDSLVMRRLLQRILSEAGYEVVAQASNGQEAVEQFRRHRPDLLILDLNMPILSGLDALKIIRAEDSSARVVICSAVAVTGMIERGTERGALGYITKPFKQEQLIETVGKLFLRHQSGEESARQGDVVPGDLPSVLGNYKVGSLLGQGGMGAVYRGYDPGLGREVALKVIRKDLNANTDFVVRFLEEARAMARVDHPNVVNVYFAGSDQGCHFFAMELLPGPDLDDLIERDGPLPREKALAYLRQAALGLDAALQKDLIHCDVKPSNLMLESEGRVKVMDFGLARHFGPKKDGESPTLLGTPGFMAPEQVLEQPIDHRTDIYALGATLYLLLTGDLPYSDDDEIEVLMKHVRDPVPTLPKASRKLNRLLARMMAKAPDDRHQDYDELLVEIDRQL